MQQTLDLEEVRAECVDLSDNFQALDRSEEPPGAAAAVDSKTARPSLL